MHKLRFHTPTRLKAQLGRAAALTRAVRMAQHQSGGVVPAIGVAAGILRTQGPSGLRAWLADLAATGATRLPSWRRAATFAAYSGIQQAIETGRGVLKRKVPSTGRQRCRIGAARRRAPRPLIDPVDLEAAARAHLLVAITFHFVERRLGYLEEVLATLAALPVRRKLIAIYTNTTVSNERLAVKQTLARVGLEEGRDAEIIAREALSHPFELTWCHKQLIVNQFCAADSEFTHFVYLEDDERFTFENLAYFIAAREQLRPHGLVPAFVRTEWSTTIGTYVNTDNQQPIVLRGRPFIRTVHHTFVNLDNPYCGAFVLDRELAREYLSSPSFDQNLSRSVSSFDVRERSAMGVTFESPPPPFIYRVAVPVAANQRVPHCAWLAHTPNNYADDPASGFGKIAMTGLIEGELNAADEQGREHSFDCLYPKLEPETYRLLSPFVRQHFFPSSMATPTADLLSRKEGCTWQLVSLSPGVFDGSKLPSLEMTNAAGTDPSSLQEVAHWMVQHDRLNRGVVVLTSDWLDRLLPNPDLKFPLRALVVVVSGADNAFELQRSMFDRGMVKIAEDRINGKCTHYFLASDAITQIDALPTSRSGLVTMSSLGSNGRFATQLFQYAFVKLYALRNGLTAAVPDWEGATLFELRDYLAPPNARLNELRFDAFTEGERHLWESQQPPSNIDIRGYCQEIPDCWRWHRSLLCRLFSLPNDRATLIGDWCYDVRRGGILTLVAIHVRRGDYCDLPHDQVPWFRPVPAQWYLDLLRVIWPKLRNPVLFVATDDPASIMHEFREFAPLLASGELLARIPAHVVDLEIMRRSDVLAICNSSFSRMGALLASPRQTCFIPDFGEKRFAPYDPWSDRHFWRRFGRDPPATS